MNLTGKLKGMTLEEKVGQMFMARGLKFFPEETAEMMRQGLIGGMHVRSNDTADEVRAAQASCPVPMLIATDMEAGFCGGNFGGIRFGNQIGFGAIGSEDAAYKFGEYSARAARAFGVHFAFGPVVDIANEPASPFVNIRSFSSDPREVVRLAGAVIRGYQDNGLIVSAKHYPGAGRADVDSHIEQIVLDCTAEEFENTELYVYRELIRQANLSGVMTGHIGVRFIDGENLATLSRKITAKLFEMDFKGLLITDSLAMKGIKNYGGSGVIYRKAMEAGHDIILGDYKLSPRVQLDYMLDAVRAGYVTESRIDASALKIIKAKEHVFSINPPPSDIAAERRFAAEISRQAVVVEGDKKQLENLRDKKVLFIVAQEQLKPAVIGEITMEAEKSSFSATLRNSFPDAQILTISDNPYPDEMEATLDQALDFDEIIFVAYALIHSYKGTADFSKRLLAMLGGLRKRIKVFVIVGNPFAAREVPEFPCRVFIFDRTVTGEQAAVDLLSGKFAPTGKLPVSW